MSRSLREYALPIVTMWSMLLDRPVDLEVLEDNMSTIEIVNKGYSSKLAHIPRAHRISLAWTAEAVSQPHVILKHCPSAEQKGDSFTKALDKIKDAEAFNTLGIKTFIARVCMSQKLQVPVHLAYLAYANAP